MTGWIPGLPKPGPYESPPHDIWYHCIHVAGEKVLSELSRPDAIEDGFIVAWNERIILVGPDAWPGIAFETPDDSAGPEFDIVVERR
jgi:hypothetical protein